MKPLFTVLVLSLLVSAFEFMVIYSVIVVHRF